METPSNKGSVGDAIGEALKRAAAGPGPMVRDAILKELADQRVEMVRMALRSALNLIHTAEDKAEAEKLVRKLLDKYQ